MTELYGTIKVVTRATAPSATTPPTCSTSTRPGLPRLGRAGSDRAGGRPDHRRRLRQHALRRHPDAVKTALPEGRALPQHRRRPDRGLTRTPSWTCPARPQGQSHQSRTSASAPTASSTSTWRRLRLAETAQNLNSFRGKILRMNLDGSAPPDNPFYNAADGINAQGLRLRLRLAQPVRRRWRSRGRRTTRWRTARASTASPRSAASATGGTARGDGTNAIYNWYARRRAGEHRLRPAGDLRRQRIPRRQDGPRLRQRVRRPPTPPARRRAASASASSC